MKNMHAVIPVLVAGVVFASCSSAPERVTRTFVVPSVPGMYSDAAEVADYMCAHFWDRLLAVPDDGTLYLCDSAHVAGVDNKTMMLNAMEYVGWLVNNPSRESSAKALRGLVVKMEKCMAADTASNVFPELADILEECLYGPNSPVRDEDLYQPLAQALAESSMTPGNLRPSYSHQSRMCLLNQEGSPAADFAFADASGRMHRLYDYDKTPYTVLLFVNPGCHACGDVVQAFDNEMVRNAIRGRQLTVISVYIDPEIDEWKRQVADMPASWVNGFDRDGLIRQELIYNVRAIPSVYLLDSEHTVICKDTPPEEVFSIIFPVQG